MSRFTPTLSVKALTLAVDNVPRARLYLQMTVGPRFRPFDGNSRRKHPNCCNIIGVEALYY